LMIIPTEDSWAFGDREGICLVALFEGGQLVEKTTSARGTRR
jgi:hypothetical protein